MAPEGLAERVAESLEARADALERGKAARARRHRRPKRERETDGTGWTGIGLGGAGVKKKY